MRAKPKGGGGVLGAGTTRNTGVLGAAATRKKGVFGTGFVKREGLRKGKEGLYCDTYQYWTYM